MLKSLTKSYKKEEVKVLIRNTKLLKEVSQSTMHNLYVIINCINQGINARQGSVEISHFNEFTLQFVQLLRDLKLIYNYEVRTTRIGSSNTHSNEGTNDVSYLLRAKPMLKRTSIVIYFKMQSKGVSLLKHIQPISYPSYRKHINYYQLRKIQKYNLYSMYPYLVISTSEGGLMTHLEALEQRIGGKVIAKLHITDH